MESHPTVLFTLRPEHLDIWMFTRAFVYVGGLTHCGIMMLRERRIKRIFNIQRPRVRICVRETKEAHDLRFLVALAAHRAIVSNEMASFTSFEESGLPAFSQTMDIFSVICM